ncbi:MAG TPA: alpha/beta hydrolase [Marmoricola sp.]|nr:alpha/beta hydrolase [Marmoricola sp.]
MTVAPGRTARARRTAAALLVTGALASCSVLSDGPSLESKPIGGVAASVDTPAKLERFYEQEIRWRECRATMECAEMQVPLDYAEPGGDRVTLALLRVPATHADHRIGSLVVNPGGPGASGVEYAARADVYFGNELRAAFDIVGFDPRGVGASTPVDCVTDAQLDTFIASDPGPETLPEARMSDALMRDFGNGCLELSGDLARHMSTEEAARDIDVLRAVLGQERLAFFGASYGTFLGATYADLFPERVGRMVLDGAVDPSLGSVQQALIQAQGFEVALRAYVEHCVEEDDCYLGGSADEGMRTIQELLERVDAQPIPGDSERALTRGWATLGIWAPLYAEQNWHLLDTALSQALDGNGRALLALADAYVSRGPEGYVDNSVEALHAVNCLDRDDAITSKQALRLVPSFLEASPTFGRTFAFGLSSCHSWPVHTGKGPVELTAPGAAPILVVGTSRDPATPLAWAEALASTLSSGVLVRRDGDGHTGYGSGNDCVDEAVEKYLVSGDVPDGDVDC